MILYLPLNYYPFVPHRFQKHSTPVGETNKGWGGGQVMEGNTFSSPYSMQKIFPCTSGRGEVVEFDVRQILARQISHKGGNDP